MKHLLKISITGALLVSASTQITLAAEQAQANISFSDFQTTMLDHIDMVGSPSLQQRFAELTYADWEFIYDSFADKAAFMEGTRAMQSLDLSNGRFKEPLHGTEKLDDPLLDPFTTQALMAAMTFVPAYPSGGTYDAFTATMPGLGLLSDSPDVGTEVGTALNDERCDTNGEAGALIALGALKVTAEIGNTACSATPSPFEPAVCIPAGVLNEAVIADEIVLSQCSYQTALVDSAEIEAAFENSVELIGTVNNVDVIINDETNFTDDAELATHDSDIKTAVSTHDTDIKNVVNLHDTDIKAAVATHDADIKLALATHDGDVKALMATLQAGVDANGARLDLLLARQLEVVRLLHTPQGKRATDIPACDGNPCSWNN